MEIVCNMPTLDLGIHLLTDLFLTSHNFLLNFNPVKIIIQENAGLVSFP